MSFLYSHNGGDLRVSLTSDLCWRELERRTYAGIETIWCDELVEEGCMCGRTVPCLHVNLEIITEKYDIFD